MDCIKIEKLEIFAYHGLNEEEKINGQKFFVDAVLYSDIVTPGMSDQIDDTVNYSGVCKFINKYLTENRFDLIEAAAVQCSREILRQFPKIRQVDITINKPEAPMKLPFKNVCVMTSSKWTKAYLSIGSNVGDREENLNGAVNALYDDDNVRVNVLSKFIETEPYGPVEQDNFLNGCIEIETIYTPRELLKKINDIEDDFGRTREVHWGPRTLDIDIIFFGDEIINDVDLIIPHKEMHKRAFVLEPLSQIAEMVVHPIFQLTVEEMKDNLSDKCCKKCSECNE